MRWLLLILLPAPALAWDHTIGDVCTLWHVTESAEIRLTHDPSGPLYTMTVTRAAGWPDSPWFGMRFDGARGNVISTTRHVRSEDMTGIFVADTGFGNVLDGLQFNDVAYALTEGEFAAFPLEGAAPHVQAFRECAGVPAV
ncbi:hypothetical protein [Pseudaestuariivita atlantica]|uniref:Excinuclease ABC subunit B n=1 Tax=Pseudaestuariivita atlantica TaxID=1317121 RepID=A0A0L1JR45_9RHOB|nr:hypothetical protein [Pseudaestuariivita atlantica]KNG94187.1 hypothetical protein ATO11_08160 [Pseudaestuariivita atlantica]